MCGLHINERLVKLGEYHHLLVINRADIRLLDLSISDKILITDISKKQIDSILPMSGNERTERITYFDTYYGLLYVMKAENGELMIFHYRHREEPPNFFSGGKTSYSHSVEEIYKGTMKLSGKATGISGLLERNSYLETVLRVVVVDSEGVKFASVLVKKIFERMEEKRYYPPKAIESGVPAINPPVISKPTIVPDTEAVTRVPIDRLFGSETTIPAFFAPDTQPIVPSPSPPQVANEGSKGSEEDYEDIAEEEDEDVAKDTTMRIKEEVKKIPEAPAVSKAGYTVIKSSGIGIVTKKPVENISPPSFFPKTATVQMAPIPPVEMSIPIPMPVPVPVREEAKPPVKIETNEIGTGPAEQYKDAKQNIEELKSLVKGIIAEGVHTQFSSTIMPAIESSFKVTLKNSSIENVLRSRQLCEHGRDEILETI